MSNSDRNSPMDLLFKNGGIHYFNENFNYSSFQISGFSTSLPCKIYFAQVCHVMFSDQTKQILFNDYRDRLSSNRIIW